MTNIRKVITLDNLAVRPYLTLKNSIISFGLAIGFGLFTNALAPIYVFMGFALRFSTYPFLVGSEGELESLYTIFGIDRRTIVRGRYLWSLLTSLKTLGLALLCSLFICFIKKDALDGEYAMIMLGMFLMLSLFVAIQMPLFFYFGYRKGKEITTVSFTGLMLMVFAIVGLGSVGFFQSTLQWILNHAMLTISIAGVTYLAILFGSLFLSQHFYEQRSF